MFQPDSIELTSVIISQDLIDEVSLLREIINDPNLGIEIEPLKIYCQKTGHVIGSRDENSLFSLVKIHGKNAILNSLYNAVSLSVHPAWIETNGEKLDELMTADPIGYAVYCFGLITAEFYQNAKNIDRKRKPWIERYWALARANALLTQRGIAELTALNHELCKLLTYAPDTKAYLFKRARKMAQTPDMLAMLACTGELTPLLKSCTNQALAAIGHADNWIKRTRFVDYAATPADAARGPSNIRQQKASRRDIKEAGLFAELGKLFDESGLNIATMIQSNVPGTTAWKNRLLSNTKAKEAEMIADLTSIGGTNLDGIFEIEEDDENDQTIEVHNLSNLVGEANANNVSESGAKQEIVISPENHQDQNIQKSQGGTWEEVIAMEKFTPTQTKPLSRFEQIRAARGQK